MTTATLAMTYRLGADNWDRQRQYPGREKWRICIELWGREADRPDALACAVTTLRCRQPCRITDLLPVVNDQMRELLSSMDEYIDGCIRVFRLGR